MLLDHLLAAPCQFIKEEPGYTIRNALVSILRLAIGEPMPDRLVSILLNVIEVLRFLVFLFSHQLLFFSERQLQVRHKCTSVVAGNFPK